MTDTNPSIRTKYLESDKTFDIRRHLEQLEKEEKSGLKGIEIRSKAKELGKDDFLKILITQLSQQDPTNPMKDQDFIAQMAQFSSLEQMKNISTGITRLESKQAFSLVGKLVSGPDLVTGDDIVGIAGAVFFDGEGRTFVRVNGRSIDVEKIHFISDPGLLEGNLQADPGPYPSGPGSYDPHFSQHSEVGSGMEIRNHPRSPAAVPVNRNHAIKTYEENIPGYKVMEDISSEPEQFSNPE